MRRLTRDQQQGFTLVEAIMVIVITGIVAGMVAVFIKQPVDAYLDTARRAELTDIADTAARRMARDLQGALPNSVRVDATGKYLEFIPIHDAGRYRAEKGTVAAPGDPLDFTNLDTSFDVLGPPVTVLKGDSLVVYNLGIPGADAYQWPLSSRRLALIGGATVTFAATTAPLPFPSPGSRFQIVGMPVCYVCAGGRLLKYSEYGFPSPSTTTPTTSFGLVVPAVLATNVNVAACNFTYIAGALQRTGLVSISLTLTQGGETVTLQHQVNVDNTP